ncbi:hypothetical protein [Marinoscillum sp.]|uniref:hypothetical protein n=1 Tax=Marinoscillum sp. TaxID=2024838 RepID=UPI003BAA1C7E
MKSIAITWTLLLGSFAVLAQTPIDKLQQTNSDYLKKMESEGYGFRSQIITEFNPENAEQNVNIKLKAGHTYQLVAISDSDVKSLDLEVKSMKTHSIKSLVVPEVSGAVKELKTEKSGKFKIVLNVAEFSNAGQGFVSFMVLRK